MDANFFGDTASDVFDRIKYVLGVTTSKDLSPIINMSESGISSSIKRNSIPYAYCAELAITRNVPLDWLIFGDVDGKQFERYINCEYLDRAYKNAVIFEGNLPAVPPLTKHDEGAEIIGTQEIGSIIKQIQPPYIDLSSTNCAYIPLYDVPVSAGHGSFFDEENIIQRIPFDTEWLDREGLDAEKLACLPIKGDSMSPGLKTSDIVLINLTHQRGDGVFVLRLNGALRIKRLQWLADGRLRISSDNPIYETEYVDPASPPDDFAIIGFCHTKIGRVD